MLWTNSKGKKKKKNRQGRKRKKKLSPKKEDQNYKANKKIKIIITAYLGRLYLGFDFVV
jgi:hypothetical protein